MRRTILIPLTTQEEYRKVRNHVILGCEMLKDNPAAPKRAMFPLPQHHEKLSGRGYPNGLSGDEIHTFGGIGAIMDFYDALALILKNESDFDRKHFTILVDLIHSQDI